MGDLTKNLSRHEFACKCGCGLDTIDFMLVKILQQTADHFDAYIIITSGDRCPPHNKNEDGEEGSQHIYCRAADFKLFYYANKAQVSPKLVYEYLDNLFRIKFGLGYYHNRTHLDTRGGAKKRW